VTGNGVIQQALELDVPAHTAYDQFTQFLDFPRFVPILQHAEQIDDTHIRWRAAVGDAVVDSEWEICEQIPDKRIAWKSVGGARNSGVVTFHRIGDAQSRLMLQVDVDPAAPRARVAQEIEGQLANFKRFLVERGKATGGWRGTILSKDDRA
jgi:uncharacterized membrane protein